MRLSHDWTRARVGFDDPSLVSCARVAPVMALAEHAGLSELIADKVALGATTKVASAGCTPTDRLTSVIAGICAGADSIADLEVIRSGEMDQLFGRVYAGGRWDSCSGSSATAISASSPRCCASTWSP